MKTHEMLDLGIESFGNPFAARNKAVECGGFVYCIPGGWAHVPATPEALAYMAKFNWPLSAWA